MEEAKPAGDFIRCELMKLAEEPITEAEMDALGIILAELGYFGTFHLRSSTGQLMSDPPLAVRNSVHSPPLTQSFEETGDEEAGQAEE